MASSAHAGCRTGILHRLVDNFSRAGILLQVHAVCHQGRTIIGFIGWLMANSGQGDLSDVFEMAKQWVGFGDPNAQARGYRNWQRLGGGTRANRGVPVDGARQARRKRHNRPVSDGLCRLDAALGVGGEGLDTQNVVQSFVKQALAKAAGLEEWLGGGTESKEKEK